MKTGNRAALVLASTLIVCSTALTSTAATANVLPADFGTRPGTIHGSINDFTENGGAVGYDDKGELLWTSPGSYVSFPGDITLSRLNNHGQAVGLRQQNGALQGVLANADGSVTTLMPGYADFSNGVAINDKGEVAVRFGAGKLGLWRNGKLTEIAPPGGPSPKLDIWPVDINEAGQIAATVVDQGSTPEKGYPARCDPHGCTRLPLPVGIGTPDNVTLSAINASGTIAGTVVTGQRSTAVLWTGDKATALPNPFGQSSGVSAGPHALNDRGDVAGWFGQRGKLQHSALWSAGKITDLRTKPGSYTSAYAVNARGDVVGNDTDEAGKSHAFAWRQGHIDWLSTLTPASTYAIGINGAGQVGGNSVADTVPPSDGTVQRPVRWTLG